MKHRMLKSAAILLAVIASPIAAAQMPVEWDGLRRVESKRLNYVYLQPGADFRGYTKVIVDPTEVAFRKNWARDYNRSSRDLDGRVSDQEVQQAISKGVVAASDIFVEAWRKGGYEIASQPGPDVLRVQTAVVNISVAAPDVRTSSASHSFSDEAGAATLVVEVKDSLTGAVLGRAIDQAIVGDNTVAWRTRVSNRADFREVVEHWARNGVRGMGELKALSPVQ